MKRTHKKLSASLLSLVFLATANLANAQDATGVQNDSAATKPSPNNLSQLLPEQIVQKGKEPAPASSSPQTSTPASPALPATAPTKDTISYKVPCLTVRGDDTHGKISYLPLTFTRTNTDKPLRIMIIDDTPSGSGQTIHSSVWLAAVTAAMLRNDTMHGVTISVESDEASAGCRG